jgi:hypothetical protein
MSDVAQASKVGNRERCALFPESCLSPSCQAVAPPWTQEQLVYRVRYLFWFADLGYRADRYRRIARFFVDYQSLTAEDWLYGYFGNGCKWNLVISTLVIQDEDNAEVM